MSEPVLLNRELSWLEFNQRVLDQAFNHDLPALERIKFLAITGSNLDEFFMVRVGSLRIMEKEADAPADPAGLSTTAQLAAISQRAHKMIADQHRCLKELDKILKKSNIRRLKISEVTDVQEEHAERTFITGMFPTLSPIAMRGLDSMELLKNRLLYMAVRLAPEAGAKDQRFAVIPLGPGINRFIPLPTRAGYEFVMIEEMVRKHIQEFFPGEPVLECVTFRLVRNADLRVQDDLGGDLLSEMEAVIEARKRSDCVYLEVSDSASVEMMQWLRESLAVPESAIYSVSDPLDISALMFVAQLQGFRELKDEPWPPQPTADFPAGESIFSILARKNVLLCHPYDSFDPVVRMIDEAADDPDVISIKQILYRTSRNSPIVAALVRAAEHGKYVTVVVELKARFDEARNIGWARELEDAGVQIVYGVKGFKTHAKLCLIIRRDQSGLQRFMHFGTGNYNESTARMYSDISYMTSDEDLGADASTFFNSITGYSQPQKFRKLEAAPITLRDKLLEMINVEVERKAQGQKAFIMAKVNSLSDPKLIDAMYKASQAGVRIQLNIRGVCCLRPGVKGLSENINVVSIVDRFLEHSRIVYFHHGGEEKLFIASADWMPRNLDKRVELLVPIDDPAACRRLIHIMQTYFKDNTNSWTLKPDGTYERSRPESRKKASRSQESLYRHACEITRQVKHSRKTVFEPHRPSSVEK